MSVSGNGFNNAVQHLHALGLREKAEQQGNRLGSDIRAYVAETLQLANVVRG